MKVKNTLQILLLFITALVFILGCTTTGVQEGVSVTDTDSVTLEDNQVSETELPPEPPFPLFPLNQSGEPEQIQAFFDSRIVSIQDDPWGGYQVILETSLSYYWEGDFLDLSYQLIFGGLTEVMSEVGAVSEGEPLGVMGPTAYLTSRTSGIDRYMLRETEVFPVYFQEYWYFQPNWLQPNRIEYLSFRQADDPFGATENFFSRNSPSQEENQSFSIGFDPEFDIVRFPIEMNELPEPINPTETLNETEMFFFNSTGVFTLGQEIAGPDYNVGIYWLAGFDEYLSQESEPGKNVWVYGYIYTMDHTLNKVMIFVREFSPIPDEEVLEFRLSEIKGANPDLEISFPPLP